MQLSNSAVDTYNTCGYKYKLHYQDKWRSKIKTSSLVFGGAIDAGLNAMLETKLITHKVIQNDPYVSFKQQFEQEWDDTIQIYKQDIDIRLLENYSQDSLCIIDMVLSMSSKDWKPEDYDFLRPYAKETLLRKGFLMLDSYHKVFSVIDEILEIQKEIKLESEDGKSLIIGYIDFIAKLKDGRIVIFDNKTSSKRYNASNLQNSQQLALYSIAYPEATHQGYVVLNKTIPASLEVTPQMLIGSITEEYKTNIIDMFANTKEFIENEIFDRNEKSCYSYGQKCPFYEHCKRGKALSNIGSLYQK